MSIDRLLTDFHFVSSLLNTCSLNPYFKETGLLLNWKEIDIILAELNLKGALIQEVHQPVHSIVLFQLYTAQHPFTLLFSLSPSSCRFHSTRQRFKNPKKPQRFDSFLRAHLKGGRIIDAYQVRHERIIKLTINKSEVVYIVWARLWGGAANMIVTDDAGKVFDACYRRPGKGEVSGGIYDPEKQLAPRDKKNEKEFTVRDLPGTGSFNEKVETYFSSGENITNKEKLVSQLRLVFNERENHLAASLEKLTAQKAGYNNCERLKELGDLIMSSLHTVKKGDAWLNIKDFFNGNQKTDIELDPHLSPRENALAYYEKHKAAKEGLVRIEHSEKQYLRELEEITHQQKLFDSALANTQSASEQCADVDMETLSALAKTYLKKNRETAAAKAPGHQFRSGGYLFMVGRSSMENDILLRRHVQGNDYWFHSRDFPGSHVFVKTMKGKSLPLQVMLDAGNLALFYSKGKESGKGDVYYTQVKYLRRVQKGKLGKVIPTQEKNLYIVLDLKRIENLKNSSEDLLHS